MSLHSSENSNLSSEDPTSVHPYESGSRVIDQTSWYDNDNKLTPPNHTDSSFFTEKEQEAESENLSNNDLEKNLEDETKEEQSIQKPYLEECESGEIPKSEIECNDNQYQKKKEMYTQTNAGSEENTRGEDTKTPLHSSSSRTKQQHSKRQRSRTPKRKPYITDSRVHGFRTKPRSRSRSRPSKRHEHAERNTLRRDFNNEKSRVSRRDPIANFHSNNTEKRRKSPIYYRNSPKRSTNHYRSLPPLPVRQEERRRRRSLSPGRRQRPSMDYDRNQSFRDRNYRTSTRSFYDNPR